jgi:mono/diheme cytochrome c family protein
MQKRSLFMLILMMSFNVLAADAQDGRHAYLDRAQLYQDNCARCHGINGKPTLPRAANFQRKEGLRQSDQKLLIRIKNGGHGCPSFGGVLREDELLSVMSYIRTFR